MLYETETYNLDKVSLFQDKRYVAKEASTVITENISSKIYKIYHVATIHGSDVNMIKKNGFLKRIGSFIIDNADKITVNSTFTKNLIVDIARKRNEKKIEIIPMGIDLDRFVRVNDIN